MYYSKKYLKAILEKNLAQPIEVDGKLYNISKLIGYLSPVVIESRRKMNYKGFRSYNTDIYESAHQGDTNRFSIDVDIEKIKQKDYILYIHCLKVFNAQDDKELKDNMLAYCHGNIEEGLL